MPRITMTTLPLLALLLTTTVAQHQRQLFYYPPPSQEAPSYYYMPQPALQSYQPIPLQSATPGEYVLIYAGPPQHQAPFILRQQPVEETVGGTRPPGWWNTFLQSFNGLRPPVVAPAVEVPPDPVQPSEETTPSSLTPEKPEKVVEEMMIAVEQHLAERDPASLEDLGEDQAGPDEPDNEGDDESDRGDEPEAVDDGAEPTAPPAVERDVVAPPPMKKYIAVQQPQFFGNYDLLTRGAGQQVGQQSPVDSSFILFRNQQHGYALPQPFPFQHNQTPLLKTVHSHTYPAVNAPGYKRGAYIPGQSPVDLTGSVAQYVTSQALQNQHQVSLRPSQQHEFLTSHQPALQAFQSTPNQPGLINVGPGYQNVYFITSRKSGEESQAITVDADKGKKESNSSNDNSTSVSDLETAGPSVAQAKPQAIALAGPGGVAAATPVATAVVGPGGLAVSAPTATAVAGPTSGGQLSGPAAAALNKYFNVNKQKDAVEDMHHGVVAYTL